MNIVFRLFITMIMLSCVSCNLLYFLYDPNLNGKDFTKKSSSSNSSLQGSLLAFYDFEGTTLGDDQSNNNLTMVFSSTAYGTLAGPNSATALNCASSSGANSFYVSPSTTLSMGTATDFTIAFYAYFPAAPGPSAALLDWNNSAQTQLISFDGANKMTFTFDTPNIVTTGTVATGAWNHYVLIVDRDLGMYVYINGSLDASNTTTSTAFNLASDRLQICSRGTPGGGNSALTNVYLDNIGIWSRALTTSEISDLSSGSTPY